MYIKKTVILVAASCAILCLVACSTVHIEAFPEASENYNKEFENTMYREFCTVYEIKDSYFVLQNTKGENYRIESKWLGSLEVGDPVLLIYESREIGDDSFYEAEVHSVLPDDPRPAVPAL